jgi:hypothetical protein
MKIFATFLLCPGLLLAQALAPANPAHPANSMHGEAFNEGPRQAARLIPGTGDVHFPVTTKAPDAQKFVDQGVGQLHGFWYFEAERSFRQAAALDHDCALAYWGMAQANVNNQKRAAGFMKEAVKRRDKASRREQLWIDAFASYFSESKKDEKERRTAVVRALEDLTFEFPEDLEAKACAARCWRRVRCTPASTTTASTSGITKTAIAGPSTARLAAARARRPSRTCGTCPGTPFPI